MEKQAFLELLSQHNITPQGLDNKYGSSNSYEMPLPEDYEKDLGKIEEVQHWGGEGEGDSYGYVWFFPNYGFYLRADGHYYSYGDGDYMSYAKFYFVEPVQVTKTEYHAIKD